MRILMTTIFDFPHTGGLSTHVSTLKSGLEDLGHDVDVLSFSDLPKFKRDTARIPSFIVNRFAKGKGIVIGHEVRRALMAKLIKQKTMEKSYDVINAQDVYASLAAFESNVPVISTVHGYMTYEAISRGAVDDGSKVARHLQSREKEVYRRANQVITVDQRIKDYVRDLAGIESERMYNFINIDQFKPQLERRIELRKQFGFSEDDTLLFIPRRMIPKNGVVYPAMALPSIHEKYPNTHLVYAGSGEEEFTIRQLAKKHQLQDYIHILGNIPHQTIMDYYAMSDMTLIPSIHSKGVEEATSISALEGMGAGVPVIASAVGGLKEIIEHQVNGLLIEEQNPDAIREAVCTVIENPDISIEMAHQSRRLIEENYSHRAAAQRYADVYTKVINEKAGTGQATSGNIY